MSGQTTRSDPPSRLAERLALGSAIVMPGLLGGVPALGNLLVLPLMREFDVSRAAVIFLIEVGMVGNLLVSPIVGRVLLRVAPWVVLLAGAIAGGLALLGASYGASLGGVMTGYIVAHALGTGMCGVVACQTFVVRRAPERLGVISGGQTVAAAVTGVVLSLAVPPILVIEGWRAATATCGVVVLAILPALILSLMRDRTTVAEAAATDATAIGAASGSLPPSRAAPTTTAILAMGSFWLLVVAIVPLSIAALAVAIHVIPFLAERGVGTQQASLVLAGIGVASAVGALSIGALVDRIHPAAVMAGIAALTLLCLAAIAAGLGYPAIFFVTMYIGLPGVAPTLAVGVRRLFGTAAYAPIAGLVGPFLLLSAFSGAGTGWLRDQLGSYRPVFGLLAVLCAASLAASLALMRRPLPND